MGPFWTQRKVVFGLADGIAHHQNSFFDLAWVYMGWGEGQRRNLTHSRVQCEGLWRQRPQFQLLSEPIFAVQSCASYWTSE